MRISIIIGIYFLVACSKPQVNVGAVILLGHGGEGFDGQNTIYAPNSVGSIRRALDFYDLDGVELDVQFTADKKIIVYHDDFLENATQCKGRVNSLTLEEISDCSYRKQFYNQYKEQVISMDSLIYIINRLYSDKYFSLNVKIAPNDLTSVDSLAPIFVRQLKKINSLSKVATECADANFLFFMRQIDSTQTCYLVADINESNVKDVERFNLQGIVSFFESRNENLEKKLYLDDKKVFLYGQKSSKHYSNHGYKYIHGIQVDNPVLARKAFK